MIFLTMYKASVDADLATRFGELKAGLRSILTPLVTPAIDTIANVFNVPGATLRSPAQPTEFGEPTGILDAELYTDRRSLVAITLSDPTHRHVPRLRRLARSAAEDSDDKRLVIEVAFIGPDLPPRSLAPVIDVYDTVFPVKLANRRFTSPRFTELKDEGREPPTAPTAQELLAVTKLRDRAARTLATAVKASGGLLLKDAPKQLPQDHRADVEHLTTELKASGIIDSEVFVVCSKTQAQVARVPNLQVIDDLARSGVKCACGRSISEERHEEALTVTELGRSLLDKARWLTVLLIQELEGMGVPAGDILVEQNIGGDEIDCLANISGELVLIELKDKEFSLGNAYSFGAKIAIVRPQHKVIITTDKIGNDAKEHFKRARLSGGTEGDMDFLYEHSQQGRDITYIEGVQNLNEGLADLVTSIYRGDATRLLGQVLPFAVVDGAALLAAFESTIAQPKTVAA